jgi:multidrug resistance protein, MATE family
MGTDDSFRLPGCNRVRTLDRGPQKLAALISTDQLGFFKNGSVRVANELGAGSGKDARFAIVVSITTSIVLGIIFWCLILYFNDHFALLFTSSKVVLDAVHSLSVLLAFTVLLNSVQPVLSGK